MPFDPSAGLSEAGKTIAATTGAALLESQKADFEMQKVKLADELAGLREGKHREFLTSERVETQKFTGGEGDKTRANQLDVAKIGLQGHLASAGAAIQSANIHAASIEKQIAAENDRATVLQPNADMTVSLVNKVTGKATPLLGADSKPIKVRDPDLAKAQYEAIRTVENDKKEIRLKYATDLSVAQSELNKLLSQPMAMSDETLKKPIAAAKKYLDEKAAQRDAELAPYNERSRKLVESLSHNIAETTGGQDLNKYFKIPAASPGVTPSMQGIGSDSLLNNTPANNL